MKTIWNYLVANFCALVPLWVVSFGWMPDQIKVYMRGPIGEPISIVAQDATMLGEEYGTWPEGHIWRFYLREGMEWTDLAFRLPGDSCSESVERIELQKWKLLSLVKKGKGLEQSGSAGNVYRYPNPRFERVAFASKTTSVGLMGLECLLFVLSWFSACRHREEPWRALLLPVMGVSLALTLLIQAVLPLQSFLANQSAFPFTLPTLCGAIALRFSLLFAWNTLAIFLLARCFGRWIMAPVFAFTVCAYLESGILAEGEPSLNGDWSFFANHMRACWDAAAWGGVFVLVCGVHRWLKNWYGVAGLCTAIMLVASIPDVITEQKADGSNLIVQDFSPIESVIRSVAFSTNRNVLVFVIDSLEREQAHAIMEDPEAGPELRGKFRGFTEYIDNVGTWNTSLPSIANMLTGKLPESAARLADYFVSPYSAESVLVDYLESGFDVHLATDALGFGWSSRAGGAQREKDGGGVLTRRTDGELGWNLLESARFRWCPFAAKYQLAALTGLAIAKDEDWEDEATAFEPLRHAATEGSAAGTFAFFHTRGVHAPLIRARDGTLFAQTRDDAAACIESGIWVLRQLGSLLDTIRSKGIFDQSLILVLADHGNHGHGGGTGLPGNARPFLWVKAPGSAHEFTTSSAPTHSGRIAGLLRKASRKMPTEEEIEACLSATEREYRLMPEFGGTIRVWTVAEDGSFGYHEETLGTGELVPLETGTTCSLDKSALAGQHGSIMFSGVGFWPSPVLLPGHPSMGLEFLVPDPRKRYSLRLSLKMTQAQDGSADPAQAGMVFEQVGNGLSGIEVPIAYRTEAVLRGLQPDAGGKVAISGRRANGLTANVFFLELRLEEE